MLMRGEANQVGDKGRDGCASRTRHLEIKPVQVVVHQCRRVSRDNSCICFL